MVIVGERIGSREGSGVKGEEGMRIDREVLIVEKASMFLGRFMWVLV